MIQLINQNTGLLGVLAFVVVAAYGIWRRRRHHSEATGLLKEAVDRQMTEPATLHPQIDRQRCAGCGACVSVCPEGDILRLINHEAVLVSPTKCVGHGACAAACPFGAITLVFGTKTRGKELPRIASDYQTNVPGLYIAGELGGMGLIRNAVRQGKLAAENALRNLPDVPADVDLLIVGAGAAGLTAGLAALAQRKSYLCIEQDTLGGTIYHFPRQKIVMSQPAELPLVGVMKFPRNKVSKEELLDYWDRVRRDTGLSVRERCKFLGFDRQGGTFLVHTTTGDVTAKRIILAIGVRGTPRKLGVPGEALPKVTYGLLDPEAYQGRHVAVVGGGNAAAEAAQYLARPQYRNTVTMLIRSQDFDLANQENRDLLRSLAAKQAVDLCFQSTVAEVHPDHLVFDQAGRRRHVPNHDLFVFAGAELPFKMLQNLGIAIETKFGEPLAKA